MLYEKIVGNDFRVKTFEGCMKICDSILGEKSNKIQASDSILAFRRRQGCTRSCSVKFKRRWVLVNYL